MQKPYLNPGAGHITLPGPRPGHHRLVDESIYAYSWWVNADRNDADGIDTVFDAFTYPWPFADNCFDGALLAHLIEHIPHDAGAHRHLQDGWYAFFYELWRVLTPGATAHILSPYAWSQGAVTDPTHTRLITEHVFTHNGMRPQIDNFAYQNGGIHFEMVEPAKISITALFHHLLADRDRPYIQQERHNWTNHIISEFQTRINVASDIYVKLQVIK